MIKSFFDRFLDTPAIQAALRAAPTQGPPPSMHDSKLNTVSVPVAGSPNPAVITQATAVPFRVVVRNVGGNLVFLAHDSATLTSAPVAANVFQLPPGASEVFVLNVKQGLYAAAQGGGGLISIAVSEAIPNMRMEA